MAWFTKQTPTEVRALTLPRIAFAMVGAGLVLYGLRKQGDIVKKARQFGRVRNPCKDAWIDATGGCVSESGCAA